MTFEACSPIGIYWEEILKSYANTHRFRDELELSPSLRTPNAARHMPASGMDRDPWSFIPGRRSEDVGGRTASSASMRSFNARTFIARSCFVCLPLASGITLPFLEGLGDVVLRNEAGEVEGAMPARDDGDTTGPGAMGPSPRGIALSEYIELGEGGAS